MPATFRNPLSIASETNRAMRATDADMRDTIARTRALILDSHALLANLRRALDENGMQGAARVWPLRRL